MFIFTAKIPKKRLVTAVAVLLCCGAVILSALFLSLGKSAAAGAQLASARSNDDRVARLNSLGWTVVTEPVNTEELLIPDTFDESYTDYLALQQEQGFDLTQYCGKRIKRYTYRITNYPDGRKDMTAALLVWKKRIIGGHIQSDDGRLLHGLTLPEIGPQ